MSKDGLADKATQQHLIRCVNDLCNHVKDCLPRGYEIVLTMSREESTMELIHQETGERVHVDGEYGVSLVDLMCCRADEDVEERMAAESASTPAIVVPDDVLVDPFPAEETASPAESLPEMWRWTNWERSGVLNGYRLTVCFYVVYGVIQLSLNERGTFVPEFLKPWVGKSLAELMSYAEFGSLKRIGRLS